MFSLFRKPYKHSWTKKNKLLSIILFGLFIFLFLYLFKPFGLYQLKPGEQFFISLGFGFITTAVLIVYKFIIEPAVLPETITLGKSVLWDILIASSIGAANYAYICIIFSLDFSFLYLLYSMWTAILVGSIPVTINYFILFNRLYKEALKEQDVKIENITWENEITITAGYPRNDFKAKPGEIMYLCSNDNYVTIVTNSDGAPAKNTIRGTLKSAEHELRNSSRFFRCHKCYIVNLDYVEKVTGNSQNMKIRLSDSGTEIPVARSKADPLVKRLK
jgi:hypothetical protein